MIPHALFEKVKGHFNGDVNLAWKWWNTPQGALGCSPLMALKNGQKQKVLKTLNYLLKGYFQ